MNEVIKIILSDNPKETIEKNREYILKIIPELRLCINFNQHSIWHIYDIYNYILEGIGNTPSDIELRLAALFHDIGKPYTSKLDENGGYFRNHWIA